MENLTIIFTEETDAVAVWHLYNMYIYIIIFLTRHGFREFPCKQQADDNRFFAPAVITTLYTYHALQPAGYMFYNRTNNVNSIRTIRPR